MPATAAAAALAAASMAGIPLFFGFIAKEQFYGAVQLAGAGGAAIGVLIALAVVASTCLGAAGFIAGLAPFFARSQTTPSSHDAPAAMWLAPLGLGCIGVLLGIVPGLAAGPVSLATLAVTGTSSAVALVLWHGLNTTLVLSVVTLAGSVALFVVRDRLWQITWPVGLRTERVYSGVVSGLDRVSRRIAPALQSASLRSYVLTVIVTAVALVTTAVATGGVLPEPRRWTPVHFHEAVLALIVVAAAVSAVFARSTMAAVLSLGTVGYGVAVLYALFGAPDLAMTQFAVETLTVVIFVLVFYKLRGFGDLSSRLVKARDAAVAVAAGAVVMTLVLFVGASGTTSRLAGYFADAAPHLAHGLNVVNVILVDFRGFDTLGETTVLVTVAVGVRALLLIGREKRS
jgi:multicomponent Na+:H+ antiporter subunit A